VEPEVGERVTTHIEYPNTASEEIISTGSVPDIWVRSPLTVCLEQINYTDLARDELLDLLNNTNFILILTQWNWIDCGANLVRHILFWPSELTGLIPFFTTYHYESRFSALFLFVKTKAGSKLKGEHDMRVVVSKTSRRIERLLVSSSSLPNNDYNKFIALLGIWLCVFAQIFSANVLSNICFK